MSALIMSPALIADRIDGFLFCNEHVNRDVAVYVKCIHLTWVPSMEVNTAAFHTCLCKYFSGKMGTRHVCVCVYVNALVINVRLQQHMCEVICLLWQWLMYMFSRKWRVWAFMHMKGLDWVMICILYRRFLSEDDPNMADLYTRLYNSALEWANSSTLTFPVPKTWVLSHSQSSDSSGANNEKCRPRQKKKKISHKKTA